MAFLPISSSMSVTLALSAFHPYLSLHVSADEATCNLGGSFFFIQHTHLARSQLVVHLGSYHVFRQHLKLRFGPLQGLVDRILGI